ncbi:zinc transporter ZIP4, partial [Trichonephila clavata]
MVVMQMVHGEDRCFSAEEILDQLPYASNRDDVIRNTRQMFAIVMGHIFEGNCIDVGESTTDFLDDIFHHYGDNCSPYMSLTGLKRMIHDLQTGQGDDHDHNHHHSHHHDNAHEDVHECDHIHGHFAHNHAHDHSKHDHDHPHYEHHVHNDSDDHDHSTHDHYHTMPGHDHSNHDHYHTKPNHTIETKPASLKLAEELSVSSKDSKQTVPVTAKDFNSVSSISESTTATMEAEFNLRNIAIDDASNDKTTIYVEASEMETPTESSVILDEKQMNDSSEVPEPSVEPNRRVTRTLHSMEEKEFIAPAASLRKRRTQSVYGSRTKRNSSSVASLATKCLNAEELIQKFGHQANSSLTKTDFIELCPALIQQIVSGVCTNPPLPPPPSPPRMEIYGYGSLSVFIISLTSLAGVLLLPIMTKHAYNYIISGFYGLAFSTLAADALLHLMPQFLGLHSHGPGEDHGHSHEGGFFEPYAQLQLGVFFTVYGLFLFESIMCAFSKSDHSHQQ